MTAIFIQIPEAIIKTPMRILVDYRPALRERTGVGEYIHQLVRSYVDFSDDEVAIFTSSWKDRPGPGLAAELGVQVVDAHIPVRVLNLLWHRAEWPPVEQLAGDVDVVHGAHPLLIPARRAAQVVTIHDLFFMSGGAATHGEIRRDYASLAAGHARRADAIVTSTMHGRDLVASGFGVNPERIYVCPPGAPRWNTLGVPRDLPRDGYVLFIGTLEPRKNVGMLLDAYELLLARGLTPPPLVLAGRTTPDARPWLARIARRPLAARVTHRGYVPEAEREALYAGARLLVLPSLDEGFGLPALEAMAAGVPLIASRRGSLPEVVGAGGYLLDALTADALASAIHDMTTNEQLARSWAEAGRQRAAAFRWEAAAATLQRVYADAVERRRSR
jgi:glycosyltransferase involved in cell wall biosynthesis